MNQERFSTAKQSIIGINRSAPDRIQQLEKNVFPILLDLSNTQLIDVFGIVQFLFKLSKKETAHLRDLFDEFKRSYKGANDESHPGADTEQAALELLTSDNLFNRLTDDLATLGLVGEKENARILFLVCMSAKMSRPLHAIVFGNSSGGKTALVKGVLSLLPKSAKLIVASTSTRAFDYVDPKDTFRRVLFVEEFEGMAGTLDSIRVIISESNSTRLVTAQDPKTGRFGVQRSNAGGHHFSLITTTTRAFIQTETLNRVMCLQIDQRKAHLKDVGEGIRTRHTREFKKDIARKRRIVETYQAIHGLLETVEVNIPFVHLIRFPNEQARHNRDLEKFLNLIEAIAFVRQQQKERSLDGDTTYIDADVTDYRIAYNLLPFALAEAVEELTTPERTVLKLAIQCSMIRVLHEEEVTTRSILEQAQSSGADVGDQTRVGAVMKSLEVKGFLDLVSGSKQGSRRKYKLASSVRLDERGEIVGLRDPLLKRVSTPEEIAKALEEPVQNMNAPQNSQLDRAKVLLASQSQLTEKEAAPEQVLTPTPQAPMPPPIPPPPYANPFVREAELKKQQSS